MNAAVGSSSAPSENEAQGHTPVDESGGIAQTLPDREYVAEPSTAEDRLSKLTIGSTLPDTRLKIVRWLGQGGMGVVFEVKHLDIERRYAAKLLSVAKNPTRTRRFRDEARTIAQIGSPWIVEVFDFKELSDGRLMYVMELVEGPSLYALLRDQGPLPLPRVLALARQICKGLHDAHQGGFVHRDIKPENIMLGVDSEGREQVKLVDFGLATLREGPKQANTAGTPAYMSPEQCRGEDTDERTDIYSLGVTLYELACGRLPFSGQTERELRLKHLSDKPTPPSQLGLGLPPALDELLSRCLAKQARDRFASAAELEAALIELQLSLHLRTTADHLPAPKLDDDKRWRRLEDGLARARNTDQRTERRRVIVGVSLLVMLGAAVAIGWRIDDQERAATLAEGQREIGALSERARAAAAQARWVYPSPDEPEADTSYRVVLELEQLGIPGARQAARGLRDEFAGTLVALGDRYWDEYGVRQFAKEFYVQALLFAPDHPRAGERVDLSPVELLDLREQAREGNFTPSQLHFVETLDSLAEADPVLRRERLVAARDRGRLSRSSAEELEQVLELLGSPAEPTLDSDGTTTRAGGAAMLESDETGTETGSEPDIDPNIDTDIDTDGETGTELDDQAAPPSDANTGVAVKTTLAQAKAAYESGRDDDAARLFHQALARDRNNVDALIGLHRIAFDRGEYREALDYAKRALAKRPKRGDLQVYVGDACMKVLDYGCARQHYKAALELGDRRAQTRLNHLNERVGSGK